MSTKKIVALSAGLGQPSSTRLLADRLVEATTRDLVGRGSFVEVEVVELRDLAHEVTDAMLTGFAPPALAEALEKVTSADGVIAVTPVFSSSYSGLFKSFVDVMDHKKWRVTEEPVDILYTEYSMSKGQSLINGVNILADGLLSKRLP